MDFTEIKLSGKTRREHDLLGEMEIPEEYYFGVQTMRAVENFHISRVRLNFFPRLIHALADVKQGAAAANRDQGLLEPAIADAIIRACEELRAGKLEEQFVVAMVQGGALLGQDLPPYVIVRNDTLRFAGINKIGLARRGFSHERIAEIHDACRILFQSGLNYLNGCDEVEKQVPQSPERDTLLEFIRTSKRGIIKPYESRCKEE